MKRLAPQLVSVEGEASFRLDFSVEGPALYLVQGWVSASLELECQRCLSALTYRVDSEVRLALAATDAEAERHQELYDPLLVEDELLTVKDLIEEELLLALPVVPLHAVPGECDAEMLARMGAEAEPEEDERANPFAVLKQLKNGPSSA